MPDEETDGLDAETFLRTLDDRLLQMTDDEVYQRLDKIEAEEALLNWHDDCERMLELTREYARFCVCFRRGWNGIQSSSSGTSGVNNGAVR